MRKRCLIALFLFLALAALPLYSEQHFQVVVMGSGGGPMENDLSGYLIAQAGSNEFISLDAGTLLAGITRAEQETGFGAIPTSAPSPYLPQAQILRDRIKAYLISHAHLDHVAGLVINSTLDTNKPIFGIPDTIDNLRDHLFNWKIWPNFGSEGKKPYLNKYSYQRLKPGQRVPIPGTAMTVEAFPLSHPDQYLSTAFLIESSDSYVLYLGDTAPDILSPKKRLSKVWQRVAPLIRQKKVQAIFIECSYTDAQNKNQLFGHLDPQFLMQELDHLACEVNSDSSQTSLAGLKVLVTHIKESLLKNSTARELIEQELTSQNDLGIDFIFPHQGQKIEL